MVMPEIKEKDEGKVNKMCPKGDIHSREMIFEK